MINLKTCTILANQAGDKTYFKLFQQKKPALFSRTRQEKNCFQDNECI